MNFRDELVREAQSLPVPNTDLDAIITTARVRTRRRRVATSTLAAGFVIAGSAFGIQQLSAARSGANQATAPVPTVPTDGATTTVPSLSEAMTFENGESIQLDGAIAAQGAPANITWSIVEPNSPEALAARFDSSQRYAFATMPATGPEDVAQEQLFEQGADGTWSPIEFDNPGFLQPVVSGDTIYGIGTAPATAGGAPGAFGTFDTASGSWQLQELPEAVRPYQSDMVESGLTVTAIPIDGGAVAAISTSQPQLRWDALPGSESSPMAPYIEDNLVHIVTSCDDAAIEAEMNKSEIANDTLSSDLDYEKFYNQVYQANCQEETYDPAQLGITPADLDALQRPSSTTLWKLTPGSIEPFEGPGLPLDGIEEMRMTNGSILAVYRNQTPETYTIGRDGSFTRVFADLPPMAADASWGAASGENGQALSGIDRYVVSATPGNPSVIADISPLVVTPDMINSTVWTAQTAVAGPLMAVRADVSFENPSSITEPTTISDSGYSLVISPEGGTSVIEDATGRDPSSSYMLSTESGKVELLLLSDMAPPMTTPEGPIDEFTEVVFEPETETVATFDIDWTQVPGLNSQSKNFVLTSTDGVNFAVTNIEEVLGANAWVQDMQTTGDGRLVITAYNPDNDQETILVGTPN